MDFYVFHQIQKVTHNLKISSKAITNITLQLVIPSHRYTSVELRSDTQQRQPYILSHNIRIEAYVGIEPWFEVLFQSGVESSIIHQKGEGKYSFLDLENP